MPEGLAAALAQPQVAALAGLAFVVGGVYGFAGFGAALIFMPIAAALTSPEQAAICMGLFGLSSIVTVLPRAWTEADRPRVLTMLGTSLLFLPAGTYLLKVTDPVPIRWAISGAVAITLVALVTGWRYAARPGYAAHAGIGAASGVIGGATGMTGPPVILFYLSGPGAAAATRANTIVFLTLLGAALIPSLALQGLVTAAALWLGALLVPLYMLGTRVGQALFVPGRTHIYRTVAYLLILAALLAGLPVWA